MTSSRQHIEGKNEHLNMYKETNARRADGVSVVTTSPRMHDPVHGEEPAPPQRPLGLCSQL